MVLINNKFMFFNAPGNPTSLKRRVYLFAATILGLLLSFIAHALIEIKYLRFALDNSWLVSFYNSCALPPVFSIALLVLGAVGGFFLGRFWWRKVYIERVWVKKYLPRK
ncbi:MAG: hypothetical protein V1801_00910 [Candidatus Falkowbacteria bacterium]